LTEKMIGLTPMFLIMPCPLRRADGWSARRRRVRTDFGEAKVTFQACAFLFEYQNSRRAQVRILAA
jgi:hypothetical protein